LQTLPEPNQHLNFDKGYNENAIGMVWKTGFDTAKGKLIRTVF
jgi:hypothetical protein